jgi:hypothetical protein
VVRGRLLGALPEDALEAWRGGREGSGRLFGRDDVFERMPTALPVSGARFGYSLAADEQRSLPVLLAEYLRAWRSGGVS